MKNSCRKIRIVNVGLLIIAFVFLTSTVANAQLSIVPIGTETGVGSLHINQRTEAISFDILAFFDDFATTNTAYPSSRWWIPGGGVYVNNTLATTQPSLNIATFDGLDSKGFPYQSDNPLAQNFTDTLTSQPVDLSSLSAKDSVYLSFYWLAKGLGEKPDSGDVFRLEFKDRLGAWQSAWFNDGTTLQDSLFTQEMILVSDPSFFHADFQFRFRSYGRLSGAYDTWHLDYIYFNKNRTKTTPFVYDLAVRKPLTSLLKQFTAMPIRKFRENPSAFTAGSINTDVKSNKDVFDTSNAQLKISSSGKTVFSSSLSNIITSPFASKTLAMPIEALQLTANDDTLRTMIRLITTDTRTPKVDLLRNDSISAQTILSNFYAYDDGSAEHGIQMNQKLGRTAVRFAIPGSDTLAGLKMSLLPFNKSVAGQSFTIQVWTDKDGRPETLLGQQAFAASYPANRDGFIEFTFTNPIVVKDVFYIGWLQINEQPIIVGYDRNSPLGKDQIFINVSNLWGQEKSFTGSIMIRPFMGGKGAEHPVGTEPVSVTDEHFFPNPAQNVINWRSASLRKIDIYSVTGLLVKTVYPRGEERSADISQVPTGIYIFDAFDGKRNFAQKIIIVR